MVLLAAAMLQLVKASWEDAQDPPDAPGMGLRARPRRFISPVTSTRPHLLLSKLQLFLQGVHLLCPLHSMSSLIAVLNQLEKGKPRKGMGEWQDTEPSRPPHQHHGEGSDPLP